MDADELLKRYAAGDRDFTRADLSGETLVNARLSGANFAYADLSRVNLTEAELIALISAEQICSVRR